MMTRKKTTSTKITSTATEGIEIKYEFKRQVGNKMCDIYEL